jgi:hypothetical protein
MYLCTPRGRCVVYSSCVFQRQLCNSVPLYSQRQVCSVAVHLPVVLAVQLYVQYPARGMCSALIIQLPNFSAKNMQLIMASKRN